MRCVTRPCREARELVSGWGRGPTEHGEGGRPPAVPREPAAQGSRERPRREGKVTSRPEGCIHKGVRADPAACGIKPQGVGGWQRRPQASRLHAHSVICAAVSLLTLLFPPFRKSEHLPAPIFQPSSPSRPPENPGRTYASQP